MQYVLMVLVRLVMELVLAQKLENVAMALTPTVDAFCPVAPPTNTSMTLPPLRCDQHGYLSCYDFGRGARNQGLGDCPPLANADKTEDDNYCLGL